MSRVLTSKAFGGDYVFDKELGAGAQAKVYKVFNKREGFEPKIYACKQTMTEYLTSVPKKKGN